MSNRGFYQVLGVGRFATADEIRSAYRELVKKHHPDLFLKAREKAAATEKLREINEAYAVLGNEARRRGYDEKLLQKSRSHVRSPVTPERRSASRPRRGGNQRRKAGEILARHLYFSKKRAAYAAAAAMSVLVWIYASGSEPKLTTAWTLMEKLEISPAKSGAPLDSAARPWVSVGQYGDVSACAAMVKKIVRADEQEGSSAVYDERKGTMAITVYVDKKAQAAAKRVRNLECRATQRLESESWLRRTLKRVGLP